MTDDTLMANRHATRDFSDRPVDLTTLQAVLTEAQAAPSWENTQPTKLYLATGATAKRLRDSHLERNNHGQKSWTEVMPPKNWADFPKANMDAWRENMLAFYGEDAPAFAGVQKNLFNAPAMVYLTLPKDSSHYSAYDAGALGYGILLAAEKHGLGAVPAYELVRYPAEIRQEFDIPEDQVIFMGISLGYATDSKLNALRTVRRPLGDILQIRD